jgi:iron complex transport system ATP-binding protein
MKRKDIARIAGIMFQDAEDPFPATVLETALIGRHPHSASWQWAHPGDEGIALEAIRAAGLSGMEMRLANSLSGGERRRLALATLLVQDPELYLLDEPTNHLDIRHQIEMLDLLTTRTTDSNKALLMILHDPNLAARYCDRMLLLFENGQTLSGASEDILNESNLSRLYHYRIASVPGPHGKIFFPAYENYTVPASGLKTGCL